MRTSTLVLLLALVPTTALADDEEDEKLVRSSSFRSLSMRFADRDIDGESSSFHGAALAIGRRFGRCTLYGEAELGYQYRTKMDGLAVGLGVHARRTICGFTMGDRREEMRIPCWVDVGVGWSSLLTRDSTVSRPVVSFGIGRGVEAATRKRSGGLLLGIGIELSPVTASARAVAPEINVERTLTPASGRRLDAGVSFTMAFLFGR
jgi:hypothetical protein